MARAGACRICAGPQYDGRDHAWVGRCGAVNDKPAGVWLAPCTVACTRGLLVAVAVAGAGATAGFGRAAPDGAEPWWALLHLWLVVLAGGAIVGLCAWILSGRWNNRAAALYDPLSSMEATDLWPGADVGLAAHLGWSHRRGPDQAEGAPEAPTVYGCAYGCVRGPCRTEEIRAMSRGCPWLLVSETPRGPWRPAGELLVAAAGGVGWWHGQIPDVVREVARAASISTKNAAWAFGVSHGDAPETLRRLLGPDVPLGLEPFIDPWDHWSDQLLGDPLAPPDGLALVIDTLAGGVVAAYVGLAALADGTRVTTYRWGRRYVVSALAYLAASAALAAALTNVG